jgi:hypothetical protein
MDLLGTSAEYAECIFPGCRNVLFARFWRLHESLVEMAAGSHSSAEALLAESEERQTRYPLYPDVVIAAAFKPAGLPGSGDSHSAIRRNAARCTRPDHRGGLEGRRTGAELIRPPNGARCIPNPGFNRDLPDCGLPQFPIRCSALATVGCLLTFQPTLTS